MLALQCFTSFWQAKACGFYANTLILLESGTFKHLCQALAFSYPSIAPRDGRPLHPMPRSLPLQLHPHSTTLAATLPLLQRHYRNSHSPLDQVFDLLVPCSSPSGRHCHVQNPLIGISLHYNLHQDEVRLWDNPHSPKAKSAHPVSQQALLQDLFRRNLRPHNHNQDPTRGIIRGLDSSMKAQKPRQCQGETWAGAATAPPQVRESAPDLCLLPWDHTFQMTTTKKSND